MEKSPSLSFAELPLLFECAWEVAHKVGGIYTVLSSKSRVTADEYGDRYCLLGMYSEASAATEFEELPLGNLLRPAIEGIKAVGIKCHFGRWLIPGYPRVILFDLESVQARLNEWKEALWASCEIGTPEDDPETNNAVLFGFSVATFLCHVRDSAPERQIIAHFHEWLAGVGLILLRAWKGQALSIATIFTTHATLLGRYLCASNADDFYNTLPNKDRDAEAKRFGIFHRYAIERSASLAAHIFTTVSDITAYEAQHTIGRNADVITPNGLNKDNMLLLHEFQTAHQKSKERIMEFVRGHFFGHYDFDLDNTLFLFTAGRYEYRNKGVDMFIESLSKLNHMLKDAGSSTTIIAFIIMPAKTSGFNADSLENQFRNRSIRDTCETITNAIGKRMYEAVSRGQMPDVASLVSKSEQVQLKRAVYEVGGASLPPIVTHNMVDSDNDEVLNHLRQVHLFNGKDDRVKVVYHPEFVKVTNPLFGLDYNDFVRGCHLGVFASYYEPWGYTPAECNVRGVPAVCTNLAGYGNFIEKHVEDPESRGCFILDRRFCGPAESVQKLAEYMLRFSKMDRRQRILMRNRTERLSELLSWDTLGEAYKNARAAALQKCEDTCETVGDLAQGLGGMKMPRSDSEIGLQNLNM